MDLAKAFTYITEDERWVNKLLIALIVMFFSFLFIPIFFLIGYSVAITRNVKDGVEKPLPEWDDWGKLFMDGLYIFLAQLVYTLPFWLLVCIAGAVTIAAGGAPTDAQDFAAAAMGTTWLIVSCLGFLLLVALFFISPAIIVQYVLTDNFGACFRFGEVFGIARQSIGDILMVFLATFGAGLAVSIVTGVLSIIPCLGWILSFVIGLVVGPYLTAVTGHLYGQIAAKFTGKSAKFAA
ncbi:MAG: DUF4013 domain-containing protein [Ardenticatenaceae bacterium]|nr:DUF4013 domain-containing protein [Anaerolineales bacterium]MCB8983710.1 DUF4013 domain-containing protein [Ardenticatenaceae bacterium]MCB8987433.1 DUF4013 domain-containing protein [Ardenticatenaceae bacterium]